MVPKSQSSSTVLRDEVLTPCGGLPGGKASIQEWRTARIENKCLEAYIYSLQRASPSRANANKQFGCTVTFLRNLDSLSLA